MKTIRKWIDGGKRFIYIRPIRLEIAWWKISRKGFYIYPAIALCKTGNTKGIQIFFLKYTVDFSYFLKD